MSSFGAPPSRSRSKPTPPERGSFPLDHEGECKQFMFPYIACLKANKGKNSDECRQLSKAYLDCRMKRNLMAPDSFNNLGFSDVPPGSAAPAGAQGKATAGSARDGPQPPPPPTFKPGTGPSTSSQ